MADEVLHAGVRGVTDLIVMPGLINLDFADIKSVISEMGKAMMGTGEAEGEDRAMRAADMAISNPLLDDVTMKGAKGVLINITGGPDLMLFEVEQAANRIRAEVDPDANIIFGNTILDEHGRTHPRLVVATGIDAAEMRMAKTVEPIRTHIKPVRIAEPAPQPTTPTRYGMASPMPARPAPSSNPVHRQMETLADGLGATKEQASSETLILGADDIPPMPMIGEDDIPPMPASIRPIQREAMRPAPAPEPERRGWFLGRKKTKEEPRMEPAPAPRPTIAPQRATTQVMARATVQGEQTRAPAPQPKGDDLFPDHKRDEQFEIPAFLRRQMN